LIDEEFEELRTEPIEQRFLELRSHLHEAPPAHLLSFFFKESSLAYSFFGTSMSTRFGEKLGGYFTGEFKYKQI
jgi:hypothetical protein